MDPARRIKQIGRECGFDLVRIATASEMHEERARYLAWIADGRHAEMQWITTERAVRSTSPQTLLPRVRSVVSVGLSYWAGHRPKPNPNAGTLARYAWGRDYHVVIGNSLRNFSDELVAEFGGEHRWYVDTGPALDRAFAARSGLGWQGKNTNIITEQFGSFVLLGEILTTLEPQPDPPLQQSCGSCRLCVVACPTGAIGPEYSIDSRKCISYLTIEHRGPIPVELRPNMGAWVFGCDICQEVCPPAMAPYLEDSEERHAWAAGVRSLLAGRGGSFIAPSQLPRASDHPLFHDGIRPAVDLYWLLALTHEQYVEAFRGTAIKRAKVWMLRRNAAIALGNVGDAGAVAPLMRAVKEDEHPIVRSHAAWAIGHLAERLHIELPEDVQLALESVTDEWDREEFRVLR